MGDCEFEYLWEGSVAKRCRHCGLVVRTKFPPEKIFGNGTCNAAIHLVQFKRKPKPIGPGQHLKRLLARPVKMLEWAGFRAACNCEAHAAEMDRRGVEWCRENVATIVGWLEEGAKKRKLPFSPIVAKLFVERAIRAAERDASTKRATTPE